MDLTRLETKETEIDGVRVMATPLPALRALALLAKLGKHGTPLLKAITPALDMIASPKGESAEDFRARFAAALIKSADDSLVEALRNMFATFGPDDIVALGRDIVASTVLIDDGQKLSLASEGDFTKAFTGRMVMFFRVALFSLGVTYADFSVAASVLLAGSRKRAAAATKTPSSPTQT